MPRTKMPVLVIAAAILIAALVHAAGDGPPARGIPYRGHLDLNGVAVNAQIDMTFTIFDDPVAGAALHTEPLTVDVANGDFAVVLGQNGTALPDAVFSAAELFVAIDVDGTPLAGRQQIWALPQATRAGRGTDFTVTGQLAVQGGLQIAPGAEVSAGSSLWGGLSDITAAALATDNANPLTATSNGMVTVVLDANVNTGRGYCAAYVEPAGQTGFSLVGRVSVHRYAAPGDAHNYHQDSMFPVGIGDRWYLDCVDTFSTISRQVWFRPLMP